MLVNTTQIVAPEQMPVTAPGAALTTRLCLGYGIGSIGSTVLLNVVTTYFSAFMSTVLGQSVALAGLLLTLSKIYDIGADLVIGMASDRTRSRWGRRRPYLLAGTLTASIAFLMLFVPPHVAGATLIVYLALTLVLYSTGYSLYAVPYTAMAGEMTDGYRERTRLQSFRVFFISAGQIISAAGAAALIEGAGRGEHAYAVMGVVMSAVIAVTMTVGFLGTARARRVERAARNRPVPLPERLRILLGNRPLVLLIGAKFFQYTSVAVFSGAKILFILNVLQAGYTGAVHLSIAQDLAGAASIPFWVALGARFGKRNTYILAISCLTAVYVSWAWARLGIPMAQISLRGALAGASGAGMILMSLSMLTDTMEYDSIRSGGLRREGLLASLFATVEKLGFALGPAIVGGILAMAGYVPTVGGTLTAQPPAATHALYLGMCAIPALLLVFSALLMLRYTLTEAALTRGSALPLAAPHQG